MPEGLLRRWEVLVATASGIGAVAGLVLATHHQTRQMEIESNRDAVAITQRVDERLIETGRRITELANSDREGEAKEALMEFELESMLHTIEAYLEDADTLGTASQRRRLLLGTLRTLDSRHSDLGGHLQRNYPKAADLYSER